MSKKNACCSVAKSCLTLCNHIDCSTPGFPVLQYLPEFAQTHVPWVNENSDNPTISSSVPCLLLPSVFPSIRVFSKESALCSKWPKYWSFSSSIFHWRFRASIEDSVLPLKIQGWFPLELTGLISLLSNNTLWGFPGGPVVKNPPANSGDMVWFVVQEDTSCHGGAKLVCHNYLSLCFRALELQQEKLPQWEAHTLQLDSNPCLPQLQKAMKTQSSPPKNK